MRPISKYWKNRLWCKYPMASVSVYRTRRVIMCCRIMGIGVGSLNAGWPRVHYRNCHCPGKAHWGIAVGRVKRERTGLNDQG